MSREFDASDLPDETNIQVGLAHEGSDPGEGGRSGWGCVTHVCFSVKALLIISLPHLDHNSDAITKQGQTSRTF